MLAYAIIFCIYFTQICINSNADPLRLMGIWHNTFISADDKGILLTRQQLTMLCNCLRYTGSTGLNNAALNALMHILALPVTGGMLVSLFKY